MSFVSKVIDGIRGGIAPAGDSPGGRPGSSYMRGGRGITFEGWRPVRREAQDEIAASWEDAASRVTDAIHNSGWLAGAIDQAVANTVGNGLRLRAMPENDLFGMDETAARSWARMVEAKFGLWADNAQECDIQGLRTFGQMQEAGFRSWLATGEILSELPWRRRSWNRYGTKVRMLSPHRLTRKTDEMRRLFMGVFTNMDGMPVGYLGNRKDPYLGTVDYFVRARDGMGRPGVIHVHNGPIGTYRGISPLTPALQVVRQFDQLSDATLTAAIVQTLFAVSVKGDAPTEEVLAGLLTPQEQAQMAVSGMSPIDAYMDMTAGFYDSATLNVGINGRVSHLFPGQEMEFHSTEHPNGNYKDYAQHLLREIARCLGLTYESATGDYTGATYSSVRMGAGEIFSITRARRKHVVSPFCQPIYAAWLEEAIQNGEIEFPGGIAAYLANRSAASRAEWRGSPKPQADDTKLAQAHKLWRDMGVISDEMIANDLGMDIDDVYAQRAREADLRAEYGLKDVAPVTPPQIGGPGGDAGSSDPAANDPAADPNATEDDQGNPTEDAANVAGN